MNSGCIVKNRPKISEYYCDLQVLCQKLLKKYSKPCMKKGCAAIATQP